MVLYSVLQKVLLISVIFTCLTAQPLRNPLSRGQPYKRVDIKRAVKTLPKNNNKYIAYLVEDSGQIKLSNKHTTNQVDWSKQKECAYRFEMEQENNRIPRHINVAKLTSPNDSKTLSKCSPIKQDFEVLKWDNSDPSGIVYKKEIQTKTVAFRKNEPV